jgi:hypothetical protein
LSSRIDALEKDLMSLKASKNSGAADTAVLSQSLADLKAKIGSGVGYGPELERVQRLAPAAPGLDVLALNAAQGLPDAKGLAAELTALAETLPKPAVVVQVLCGFATSVTRIGLRQRCLPRRWQSKAS